MSYDRKPIARRTHANITVAPADTLTNMKTPTFALLHVRKCIRALFLTTLMAWSVSAQEIGYVETFGLAGDREAALKELVPGTDDYFYYHALQAQNTGQRERFQEVIDRWKRERNGQVTDGARELLNRQALLDYDKDPQKTLKYLREQLDLHFDHARKTGERRSDAPTSFDNSLDQRRRAAQAGPGRGAEATSSESKTPGWSWRPARRSPTTSAATCWRASSGRITRLSWT